MRCLRVQALGKGSLIAVQATISEQCDKINAARMHWYGWLHVFATAEHLLACILAAEVKHRMSQFASRASADLHTFMLLALQGECREKTVWKDLRILSAEQKSLPRFFNKKARLCEDETELDAEWEFMC